MRTRGLQMSLATLLVLVACVALNFWFFRVHVFLGLVSLNISKHILVAGICRAVGVNRREDIEPCASSEGSSWNGLA
jgi:hypothetical protein